IAPAAETRAAALVGSHSHGVAVSTFDVISGLTGAGRYLLSRTDSPQCRRALESVLDVVVYLSEHDAEGVPHWYTPPRHLTGSFLLSRYPEGNVNLGLAHGVPGPLALLSLATMAGVDRTGQAEAIDRIADRLCGAQIDDRWGVNFPTAVAVGSRQAGSP